LNISMHVPLHEILDMERNIVMSVPINLDDTPHIARKRRHVCRTSVLE